MKQRNFLARETGAALDGAGATPVVAARPVPRPAADTVLGWNRVALQAIRVARCDAATGARTLALLHTCMYNAWAAYDDTARQTMGGVPVRLPRAERSAASRMCAMSHAARLALAGRFPAQRPLFDAHLARLGLGGDDTGALAPAAIGRTQAASMLDACAEPAAVDFSAAVTAAAPAVHAAHVLPARWCRLAHELARQAGYDDDRAVLLFFVLANALADAASAAASLRQACAATHPVVDMRSLLRGRTLLDAGDGSCADPQAGRILFDAAAADVLRRFTGSRTVADGEGLPGRELGRRVGALVFERARGYWMGRNPSHVAPGVAEIEVPPAVTHVQGSAR